MSKPFPDALDNSDVALCELIAQRIANSPQQRLTFAEYMDLALYEPQHGYYAVNRADIGVTGDFLTSPHLSADFGELLAEQFVDIWQNLGRPQPFTLVEMGAGQGILTGDLLRYANRHHPDFFASLNYIIIEKAAGLIAEQQQRLNAFVQEWGRLRWCNLEDLAPDSITGCFFSNELVDALPVHQVVLNQGQLQEVYVTLAVEGKGFQEVLGEPSTSRLVQYFEMIGIDLNSEQYIDGYRTEVNLAALDWLSAVAQRLQRGYLVTIDYGYDARHYYSPRRSTGTLLCYYRHTANDNPYQHVGHQDLTAHANFTALERYGERCGLDLVGLTQQGFFLTALGLCDRLSALHSLSPKTNQELQEQLQRRQSLQLLVNPNGLGNFGVLVQSKGLTAAENGRSLRGLSVPL